jgi:taurine dioxygenase
MTVHTDESANATREHPAVRAHGETGRPALFVNAQYTIGLAGWAAHEARWLLERLFRHATQEAFTCRWHWEAGDVAFWDNRCVQHMAMADVSGHRRYMHRTTVAGEVPIRA